MIWINRAVLVTGSIGIGFLLFSSMLRSEQQRGEPESQSLSSSISRDSEQSNRSRDLVPDAYRNGKVESSDNPTQLADLEYIFAETFGDISLEEILEAFLRGDYKDEIAEVMEDPEFIEIMSTVLADTTHYFEATKNSQPTYEERAIERYRDRWSSYIADLGLEDSDASVVESIIIEIEKRDSELLMMWSNGDIDIETSMRLTNELDQDAANSLSNYLTAAEVSDFQATWQDRFSLDPPIESAPTLTAAQRIENDLFWHAISGETAELKSLIAAGADVNFEAADTGESLLLSASGTGQLESINTLLDLGADINGTNNYGETPLIRAASRGHAEAVRLLVSAGADLNIRDNLGRSPMVAALVNQKLGRNYLEIERILIEAGAKALR